MGISGFRADLGLGDDFFGSREDAFSETVRKKRWEWYVDDFSARLKPKAKRILMNTRWHTDDVAGRVLDQIERGIVRGRVISIPAIAEANDVLGRRPGEYLWDDPEGYDYGSFLRGRQRESSPMMWAALYQQRPAPEDGDYFKAEWLKDCDILPSTSTLRIYGASDYAVTTDGGDFTVHVVIGIDPEGRMFLLDVWRKQASSDVWIEAFCDLVTKWKPIGWAEETGQIRAGIGPFLDKRSRERGALYRSIKHLQALPPETRLFMCHDYKAPGRDQYAWETTVKEQCEKNVHVREGVTEEEFVAMRCKRDATLAAPRLLLPSIQVNIRAGKFPPKKTNGVRYLVIPVKPKGGAEAGV